MILTQPIQNESLDYSKNHIFLFYVQTRIKFSTIFEALLFQFKLLKHAIPIS